MQPTSRVRDQMNEPVPNQHRADLFALHGAALIVPFAADILALRRCVLKRCERSFRPGLCRFNVPYQISRLAML